MEDIKYIAVESTDGELIAFVDDEQVTFKDGYQVVEGFGEPLFEEVNGEPRLVHEEVIEVSPKKGV